MTTSNCLFGNISTIYMATAKNPIFWLLYIIQVFSYCASPNYLSTANRPTISPLVIFYIFCYSAKKNCMTTSNRLFGKKSTIYMATAQSRIFKLLRIYYFPTANIPIIYLLQIEKLLQHWKSSKYLITLHRKIE